MQAAGGARIVGLAVAAMVDLAAEKAMPNLAAKEALAGLAGGGGRLWAVGCGSDGRAGRKRSYARPCC